MIEQGTNIWAVQAVQISVAIRHRLVRIDAIGDVKTLLEHGIIADSSL